MSATKRHARGELHGAASGVPRRPGRILSLAWVLAGQSPKEVGKPNSHAGGEGRQRFITLIAPLADLGVAVPGWGGLAAFFSHLVQSLSC
jgi:hypothetical protein